MANGWGEHKDTVMPTEKKARVDALAMGANGTTELCALINRASAAREVGGGESSVHESSLPPVTNMCTVVKARAATASPQCPCTRHVRL